MNPGNIGTILRTCDSLGVDGVIVSGHSADLYEPETIRATTGSFFSLPALRVPSHIEVLKWVEGLKETIDGLQVVGTSAKASLPVMEHNLTLPTVLLIGNETHGLSQNYKAICDALVTIPQVGSATSMNMAVAAGILLYEASRQRLAQTKKGCPPH
jgi:TrmH family RNA methyltransferase